MHCQFSALNFVKGSSVILALSPPPLQTIAWYASQANNLMSSPRLIVENNSFYDNDNEIAWMWLIKTEPLSGGGKTQCQFHSLNFVKGSSSIILALSLLLLHCKQSRDMPLKLITFFATGGNGRKEGGKAGSPFPLSRYQARNGKAREEEEEPRGPI